jgi:hypothetical protein
LILYKWSVILSEEKIKLINPYEKENSAILRLGFDANPTGSYTIRFLEVNGRAKAINDLLIYRKLDKRDFKKIIKTINMQLNRSSLLSDKDKLQQDGEILEFKGGHCRLFGFISGTAREQEIIICTHGFWKTDGKGGKSNARQKQAFNTAEKFRLIYIKNQDEVE